MNARELVLLSPYRLPAQHPLTLANDDMAAWLNGYSALWHPAALRRASGPPRVDSPYDHENPRAGHIYAVPESPPAFLALGQGHMLLAALSEAMEHENLLESNDFWIDIQLAVAAAADLPAPLDTLPAQDAATVAADNQVTVAPPDSHEGMPAEGEPMV